VKVCPDCKRIYVSERDFLRGTSGWRLVSDESLFFNCSCTSPILLEPGTFSWFNPAQTMSSEAGKLFEKLVRIENVPRVSAVGAKMLVLLGKETSTTYEMSNVLKGDPVLAANVLRAATGARGLSEQAAVRNLDQAINYLGRDPLRRIVAAASVAGFKFKTREFKATDYWREAYVSGYVAEALTRKFALHLPKDVSYLAGSLANVGKCLAAIIAPDETDRISILVRKTQRPWVVVERELGGTEHGLLGEVAAAVWGLPRDCLEGILSHHGTPDVKKPFPKPDLALICTFANLLTHFLLDQAYRVQADVLAACETRFQIAGERGMKRLVEELAPIVARVDAEQSAT
jgi:HD-like signal output (HDOD) protein